MKEPKISIIVPIYNVERYFKQCVDSLIQQTLFDIEIILIDDESPDSCPQMCDEYLKTDCRVKVVHKKNEGQGLARNKGLEIAKGEYVTFVDADDCVDIKTYEIAYSYATQYDLDIMRFGCDRFFDAVTPTVIKEDISFLYIDNRKDIRQAALCLFSSPIDKKEKNLNLGGSACMAIYKRSVLLNNNIRFVSERVLIGEDSLFNYECLQHARKIGRVSIPLYHYRINAQSFSKTPRLDGIKKNIEYVKYVSAAIINDGYPTQAERYAMGYYIEYIRIYMLQILSSNLSFRQKHNWFCSEIPTDYLNTVKEKYPWHKLPTKTKLFLILAFTKSFWIAYIISNINKWVNNR